MRLLLPLFLGAFLLTSATGCTNALFGCDGDGPDYDSDAVVIESPLVSAHEIAACNGAPNGYQMSISAPADADGALLFTLEIASSVTVDTDDVLTVDEGDASPNGQMATSPSGNVRLSAIPRAEIEATPMAAAIVTVTHVPREAGDVLSVQLDVHYVDGRVLDQPFVASVIGVSNCPAN